LPRAGVADHIGSVIVAREGSRIIGCVGIETYGRVGLLRSVAVDIAHRGLGLGIQLTETALELAKQRGVTTLYLLTERSAGFFLRFGFKKIARADVDPAVQVSTQFTGACPDTAIVLQRDLPR